MVDINACAILISYDCDIIILYIHSVCLFIFIIQFILCNVNAFIQTQCVCVWSAHSKQLNSSIVERRLQTNGSTPWMRDANENVCHCRWQARSMRSHFSSFTPSVVVVVVAAHFNWNTHCELRATIQCAITYIHSFRHFTMHCNS